MNMDTTPKAIAPKPPWNPCSFSSFSGFGIITWSLPLFIQMCEWPNDPKLSDRGVRRSPCAGEGGRGAKVVGSMARDARSSSLQRMVEQSRYAERKRGRGLGSHRAGGVVGRRGDFLGGDGPQADDPAGL